MRYTLQDYSDVLFTGYKYDLPENTQNIIKNLTKELGVVIAAAIAASNVTNPPDDDFKRQGFHHNKRGKSDSRFKQRNERSDESWKGAPAFKATKIEKKEGADLLMNEIRVCLNKISNKNYEQQRDAIFKCIQEVLEEHDEGFSVREPVGFSTLPPKGAEEQRSWGFSRATKCCVAKPRLSIDSTESAIDGQCIEKPRSSRDETDVRSVDVSIRCEAASRNIDPFLESATIVANSERMKSPEDEEVQFKNVKMIAQSIFDIASSNKFYSEIYAGLYRELIEKYAFFSDYISNVITEYYEGIDKIEFVDSNKDYDKYCENNKLNDKRKAMSTFIVNLMKQQVLNKNEVLNLIISIQNKIIENIDAEDKTNWIDEVTENLYILISLVAQDQDTVIGSIEEQVSTIRSNIELFSKYKVKDHKSVSSRAIFKYMDILELL